jgi:predicted lipoprotein with Yx(FWY)xxD motif
MKTAFSTLVPIASFATLAAVLLVAASAFAQTSDSGGLLRDAAGRTLYTFDKDGANDSRCFDGCAVAWPPFMAAPDARPQGKLAPIERKGGGLQWAFDGKPLYYFAGDAKPGDAAGDGQGGVWHALRTGTAPKRAAAAAMPPAPAATGYGSSSTY